MLTTRLQHLVEDKKRRSELCECLGQWISRTGRNKMEGWGRSRRRENRITRKEKRKIRKSGTVSRNRRRMIRKMKKTRSFFSCYVQSRADRCGAGCICSSALDTHRLSINPRSDPADNKLLSNTHLSSKCWILSTHSNAMKGSVKLLHGGKGWLWSLSARSSKNLAGVTVQHSVWSIYGYPRSHTMQNNVRQKRTNKQH
jgi:hypothetical protein